MADMMRGTRGLSIGCGALLVVGLLAGCAQQKVQNPRSGTSSHTSSAARPASSTNPPQQTNVITAVAGVATSAVGAVTGAVNGAVNGAVAGSGAQSQATRRPQIKPDGRGGYDSSELQADAIRRAHAASAYLSAHDRASAAAAAARSRPTTRPTTRVSDH